MRARLGVGDGALVARLGRSGGGEDPGGGGFGGGMGAGFSPFRTQPLEKRLSASISVAALGFAGFVGLAAEKIRQRREARGGDPGGEPV